jgi:Fe-S cluster biosynthesis and repair protein YggX
MGETIKCTRCGGGNPALPKAPFSNALGERIKSQICEGCWKTWLAQQNKLMNHYGLNTMDPDHRKIILENMKAFLFNEGELAQIDTSMEGKIQH